MTTARRRLIQEPERVNPIESVHIWRTPAGSPVEMIIVAHLGAYSDIHRQATGALPNETGGFLVGRVACDQRGCWHVEIEQAVPVEPVTQNPVHFTFTWRDVDRVRNLREQQGKALLGWYHTHPDLGIFLSETDLERTHRVLFSEPFQIALVYDPVRGRAGYFFWDGAQQMNAGPAEWREFDILVAADPAAGSRDSMPIVSTPVPSSAPLAVEGPAKATDGVAASAPPPPPESAQKNDIDTPAVAQPVVPPPSRPAMTAARAPVSEAEIPTTPAISALTDAVIAREMARLAAGAVRPAEPVRTRLRQPDAPTAAEPGARGHVTPTGVVRPTPVRNTAVPSDTSSDAGTRARGTLVVAGVLFLVALVTLILWLSAS